MIIIGAKIKAMAASSRKGDVLFAVGALSDGLFDSEDVRAYAQIIEDYFADSETEAETDNECALLCNHYYC